MSKSHRQLVKAHEPVDPTLLTMQDELAAGVRKRLQSPAAQLFDEVLAEIRDFAASYEFDDDVCAAGMEFSPSFATGRSA